jgi:hypothetical protein
MKKSSINRKSRYNLPREINKISSPISDRISIILRAKAFETNLDLNTPISINDQNTIDEILTQLDRYRVDEPPTNNIEDSFLDLYGLEVDLKKISQFLIALNITIINNIAIIIKNDCIFEVDLRNAKVMITKIDDAKIKANICLQPITKGWNNQDFNDLEMTIISKIVSLQWDKIPSIVKYQIDVFLNTGEGGPNLFPYRNGSPLYNLRETIMGELRRLLDR